MCSHEGCNNPLSAKGFCRPHYIKAWRSANPRSTLGYAVAKHGMTISQFDDLLEQQGGACAICGTEPGRQRFAIDHDHACCPSKYSCGACVRGLLCGNCNAGIGMMGDDPTRVLAAANYLSAERAEPSCA